MTPAELFALLAEWQPSDFDFPDEPERLNADPRAVAFAKNIALIARVEINLGHAPESERERAAFGLWLRSVLIFLRSNTIAIRELTSHAPNREAIVTLDVVRALRRASRGNAQMARRMLASATPMSDAIRGF